MTPQAKSRARANPRWIAALFAAIALLGTGCATDGTAGAGFYGDAYDYYADPWYWGGCCAGPPVDIGPPPPRPEHPIANPPPVRPAHPIATPTPPRPTPMPRPAARSRGGRR